MKSRKILLLLILSVFLLTLAACAGEVGPQGPAGPAGPAGQTGQTGQPGAPGKDGEDGKDGKDGEDGKDGLSAFDIYKEAYPGYEGTEAKWLEELYSGKLFVTVTLNYKNGTPEIHSYMKGDKITETGWYLDQAFEESAVGHVVLENVKVYTKENYVGTPISMNFLLVTSVSFPAAPATQVFYAGGVEYVLADDVVLYDVTGVRHAQTFIATVAANTVLVDVEVLDGKVVSARLASTDVEVKASANQTNVGAVTVVAAPGQSTIEVDRYSTVQEVLDSIESKNKAPQTWEVVTLNAAGTAYVAVSKTSLVSENYFLRVTPESGQAADRELYKFTFKNLANTKNYELSIAANNKDVMSITYIGNVTFGNKIVVRPGTQLAEVKAALAPIKDSKGNFMNPEFNTRLGADPDHFVAVSSNNKDAAARDLKTGDYIVISASDALDMAYYVVVETEKDATVKKVANDVNVISVTGTVITLKYGTIVNNFVAGLQANARQTRQLQVLNVEGKYVDFAGDPAVDVIPKTAKYVVKAEDGKTTTTYTFVVQKLAESKVVSSDAVAVVDNDDANNGANKTITVAEGLTVNGLKAVLSYDYSLQYDEKVKEVLSIQIKDSEGDNRNGRLYENDKVIITSPNAGATETTTYTILTNPVALTYESFIVTAPSLVSGALGNDNFAINPNFIDGKVIRQATVAQLLKDFGNFEKYNVFTESKVFQSKDDNGNDVIDTTKEVGANGNLAAGQVYFLRLKPLGWEKEGDYVLIKVTVNAATDVVDLQLDANPVFVVDFAHGADPKEITVNHTALIEKQRVTVSLARILEDLVTLDNFQRDFKLYDGASQKLDTFELLSGGNYTIKFKSEAGTDVTYSVIIVRSNEATMVEKANSIITAVGVAAPLEVTVLPEPVRGQAVKIADILAALDLVTHKQTYKVYKGSVQVDNVHTNYNQTLPQKDENDNNIDYYIEIIAEDGATTKAYKIVLSGKETTTTLYLNDDVENEVLLVDGAGDIKYTAGKITVANGSKVSDLLSVLDLVLKFQNAEVFKNDGISKKANNATINSDNILRITSQNGSQVEDYDIIVDTKVLPVELVLHSKPTATAALAIYNAITIDNKDSVITLALDKDGNQFVTVLDIKTYVKDSNGGTFEFLDSNGVAMADGDVFYAGSIIKVTPIENAFGDEEAVTYAVNPFALD